MPPVRLSDDELSAEPRASRREQVSLTPIWGIDQRRSVADQSDMTALCAFLLIFVALLFSPLLRQLLGALFWILVLLMIWHWPSAA